MRWLSRAGRVWFRQLRCHTCDVAALLGHLGLPPVILAGASMGAMIAAETAIEYPDLVSGLIVSGRGIGEPDYRDGWSRQLAAAQASALARGDTAAWLDDFVQWAAGPQRHVIDVDPVVVSRIRQMAAHTLAKHRASQPDLRLAVPGVAARARRISVPLLAIEGALDSPEITATVDRLLRVVPHARRRVIEDAGHFPNMERPSRYSCIVAKFADQAAAR